MVEIKCSAGGEIALLLVADFGVAEVVAVGQAGQNLVLN